MTGTIIEIQKEKKWNEKKWKEMKRNEKKWKEMKNKNKNEMKNKLKTLINSNSIN